MKTSCIGHSADFFSSLTVDYIQILIFFSANFTNLSLTSFIHESSRQAMMSCFLLIDLASHDQTYLCGLLSNTILNSLPNKRTSGFNILSLGLCIHESSRYDRKRKKSFLTCFDIW